MKRSRELDEEFSFDGVVEEEEPDKEPEPKEPREPEPKDSKAEPSQEYYAGLLEILMTEPADDLSIANADLGPILSLYRDKWIAPLTKPALEEALDRFQLNDVPLVEAHDIERAYARALFACFQLRALFMSRNLLDGTRDQVDSSGLQTTFVRISDAMLSCRWLLHADLKFRKTSDPSLDTGAPKLCDPFQYMPYDPATKLSGYQELLVFVLQQLKDRGYRRFREGCWEPIMSEGILCDDGETRRFQTRAWRPARGVRDIQDFVLQVVTKEDRFKQWQNMTTGHNFKSLVEYLKTSKDIEFASLSPNRNLFSFKNGILDTEKQSFFEYQKPGIDATWVSCNYFDASFEPSWIDRIGFLRRMIPPPTTAKVVPCYKTTIDWTNVFGILELTTLATPAFTSIFEMQLSAQATNYFSSSEFMASAPKNARDLSNAEIRERHHIMFWHYALIGRLLFAIGVHDNWQVIQFFKGVAGSGKSTLLKLAGWFFRDEDVETMGNETRKGVGSLETFVDKFLWRVMELKSDFGLSQSTFQSIVSGECVVIDRLYKQTISVVWDVPGILAGNEFGGWKDNSGSIQRRVLVTNFGHMISGASKDPLLEKKLKLEIPKILFKCLAAYRFLTEIYAGHDIWNIAPDYFTWTKKKLASSTDPLGAFMAGDVFEFGLFALPLKRFQDLFRVFAEKEEVPKKIISAFVSSETEKLAASLDTYKCSIIKFTESKKAELTTKLGRALTSSETKADSIFIIGLREKGDDVLIE